MARIVKTLQLVMTMLIALALAALACNAPLAGPEPTFSLTQIANITIDPNVITPAATETPDTGQPTATLEPGITPSPTVCSYNSVFVEDVTIPDDAQIEAGSTFEKVWRVRNNGCLDWPRGTVLGFFSGERMNGPLNINVDPTSVGETADISVELTAPANEDSHIGYWQLISPDGVPFGPHIWVQIETVFPATATPELTPTATPEYGPFIGEWLNQDPDTTGITRISIRSLQGVVLVHEWTKCAPNDCDIGEASTPGSDAEDGVISITWEIGGARTSQELRVLAGGRLRVDGLVEYSDSRADQTYTYFFLREP